MTKKVSSNKTTASGSNSSNASDGKTADKTQGAAAAALPARSPMLAPSAGSCKQTAPAKFKHQRSKIHSILRLWKSNRGMSIDKKGPLQSSSAQVATDSTEQIVCKEASATVIQRAWRHSKLHRLVSDWQRTGITVDYLRQLSFEDAAQLMQNSATTKGSGQLLTALLAASPKPNTRTNTVMNDSSTALKLPGRVFVVGLLFAAHPQGLTTGNSPLDSAIESSAVTMAVTYVQFEKAFLSRDGSWYERLCTFAASYRAFYSAFDSWKRSDTKELLSTMERHYLELDRLWQSVQRRTLGKGDEAWRLGIQAQREDLLAKVRSLGGESAVSELMQKQRELRTTYSDLQPSQTPSVAPGSTTSVGGSANGTVHSPVVNGMSELDINSRQPSISPHPQSAIRNGVASANANKDPEKHGPSATLAHAISDPKSQDIDRILGHFDLTASKALQDAKLAHELVLEPNFRLMPAASNTLAGAVQQAVVRAFFDHMRQEIEAGNRDHVIRILTQLRLDLRTIISPSNSLRETLEREMDPEWMATQLKQGALDVREKFLLALQLIRSVCAPIRDGMVDELVSDIRRIESEALSSVSAAMADSATPVTRQAKDCVHALLQIARRIMELTRDVRLDALNYQLQTVVRPWLLKHAVEYERSKMEQMLQSTCKDTGAIGDKTTKWMSDAAARERDGQCTLSSRSSAAEPPSAPKPKHVFFEALLDLCFARTPLSAKDTPATLALDVERICYIQNQIQVTLSTAALCMLIKTLVKQDQQQQQQQQNRSPMSSADMARYAEELLELLGSSDVTMDQIVAAVQKAIGAASASSTAVLSKAADRLVRKTLSTEDPVFRAIEQQLRMYFLEELDKDEMPGILEKRLEQESASATASGLSRAGLDIVRKDVVALLLSICRLGQFNWQIHCKWYSKVGL